MKCAFAMLAMLFIVAAKAKANVVFTFQEIGSDVIATGSGTINLAALVFNSTLSISAGVSPSGNISRPVPAAALISMGEPAAPATLVRAASQLLPPAPATRWALASALSPYPMGTLRAPRSQAQRRFRGRRFPRSA